MNNDHRQDLTRHGPKSRRTCGAGGRAGAKPQRNKPGANPNGLLAIENVSLESPNRELPLSETRVFFNARILKEVAWAMKHPQSDDLIVCPCKKDLTVTRKVVLYVATPYPI